MSSKPDPQPAVALRGVSKSYSGVAALRPVDLSLMGGRITALAGENGAGKSTLIKILAGAVQPDSGAIEIDGQEIASDPASIINAGVSVIYQELTDVPDMSVAENLSLGSPPGRFGFVSARSLRRRAREALALVGLQGIDINKPISQLTLAQRQLAEIARCLVRKSRVLIFDEPTSSLPEHEVERLLSVIRDLRDSGIAIMYVSHHLAELFEICDDIVVLRDGELVDQRPVSQWNEAELVRSMLARSLERAYPWRSRELGSTALDVDSLTADRVRGCSLQVRAGEIIGLIGLAGAGSSEIMRAIAGVDPVDSGGVRIYDEQLRTGDLSDARRHGLVYVPEDRKRDGLVLNGTIADNLLYGNYSKVARGGWLRAGPARRFARTLMEQFSIRGNGQLPVRGLSGGNQQRVLLARFAAGGPRVVMLDDPTRGVDVGAKSSIYEIVLDLAEQGVSVIVTSSDTDEVLAVTDRSYVVRAGRIVGEVHREDYERESILAMASLG